ncbi:hypothetical protein AGOR_G00124280 [Albula goreensis]|uniref:PIH1 domain-containing protein 2 n=1 Tax=Albula goreensis TaxID=1534307 RepID=A0A8T3DBM4_9TELE|nr:hypothetical protein AGOR_G00124280 [Albula goreensis]
MSAFRGQEIDLQQVNQFWSMLDDMSDNDPESYRTFIQRQLKEGAEFCSPPQAHYCIRTVIQEPKGGLLYINMCGWNRVPTPKGPSHPIPVIGGILEAVTEGNETYSILDVAFNPRVLQEAQESQWERDQLYLLALSFAQKQHGLHVSQDYILLSDRLKGTAQSMRHRLASPHQNPRSAPAPTPPSGPSLLQQISSLLGKQNESEDSASIHLTPHNQAGPAKPPLIQVISSTESPQSRCPKHHLHVGMDTTGATRIMRLTVELPGVCSMSECQLSVSQDDLLLVVRDIYHLNVNLPEAVNEEDACAIFNKKKQTLCVTIPVL